MTYTYPNVKFSLKSRRSPDPKFIMTRFGNGIFQISPDGFNNVKVEYLITHELIPQNEYLTVINFIDNRLKDGQLVQILDYVRNPTTPPTIVGYITGVTESRPDTSGRVTVVVDFREK